jgi:hypothetical protein
MLSPPFSKTGYEAAGRHWVCFRLSKDGHTAFMPTLKLVRSGRLSAKSVLQPRDQLDCFLNLNITQSLTN